MSIWKTAVLGAALATLGLAAPTAASAAEPAAPAADDASRLSWLAGCWTGDTDGTTVEEHWTSPAGGALVGMNKSVRGTTMISFEHFRIEPQEQRLCYLSSPGGQPATSFCAIELGDGRVVFENREHDFPQRILYWRDGDRLHARIEGTVGGTPQAQDWEWSRCGG